MFWLSTAQAVEWFEMRCGTAVFCHTAMCRQPLVCLPGQAGKSEQFQLLTPPSPGSAQQVLQAHCQLKATLFSCSGIPQGYWKTASSGHPVLGSVFHNMN